MSVLSELAEQSKAGRKGGAPVYDDAYLRKQSMQGLDKSADPREYGRGTTDHQVAYDEKDYLMAKAAQTLQGTKDPQRQLEWAGDTGRESVAPHQASMPERLLMSAVEPGRKAAMLGAFLVPEVAVPADMIMGMDSGLNLLHGGMEGLREHPIRSGMEALMALSGVSRLSKAAKMNPGKFPATVRGGEDLAGAMKPYKAADSIPDVEHMWDAEDLGVAAGDQAIKTATRSKSSRAALGQLKEAGTSGRKSMLERDNILDDAGNAIAPRAQNTVSPHPTSPRSKNPYARYAMHQPGADGGDPTAMFNVTGGEHHGSTLSAAELLKRGIQIDGGIPAYNEQAVKSARDAALARLMRMQEQ